MAFKKRFILIVDSSTSNRQILCEILSDTYGILEASNEQDAWPLLQRHHKEISAVLLDLMIPSAMNGFSFLDLQQADPQFASIPVVVTTQKECANAEIEALTHGAADFLTKPYNPALIQQRLANLIKLRETAALANTLERDALTHLYNKEAFYMRVKDLLTQTPTQPFDILCADIENFKLINDMFGEREGDHLLRFIAQILDGCIHNGFVCRLGGDIFTAILPRQADYRTLVSTIQRKIQDNHSHMTNLHIKFGIYPIDNPALSVRAMCDRAKFACKLIRSPYSTPIAYYSKEIDAKQTEEREISSEMELALQQNEFVVYYQPKYDLKTERLIGAESLVRWAHPKHGLLLPNKFIPLFEKNGFITQLDFYVWNTVCRQMREWMDAGHQPVPISINLSRVDIYNAQLPESIVQILHKYALPPALIHLEITETAYTDNPKQLIESVERLKQYGFSVEMDDFGTGYSSLNMLNEVPVDTLKLDMRFLQINQNNKRSGNILFFIMDLAKWLEVSVVAEGVENRQQMLFLRSLGCDYGQGYYFAKPMPLKAFQQLLLQKTTRLSTVIPQKSEPVPSLIHADEIWKVDSPFNRIFSTFVGALALFEYQNNRLFLVRTNDAFQNEYNLSKSRIGESLTTLFCAKDPKAFNSKLPQAIQTGHAFTEQFYTSPQKDTIALVRMQVICRSSTKTLLLASVTFQREADSVSTTA